MRQSACMENLDLRTPRGLDRSTVQALASGLWIRQHRNVLISGAAGIGKSWIACALGNQAARDGVSVLYKRLSRLLDELAIATPKTKDVIALLKALGLSESSCLLTIETHDATVWKSARNIPMLSVSPASDLNAYDLLQRKTILVTKGALDLIRSGSFWAGAKQAS